MDMSLHPVKHLGEIVEQVIVKKGEKNHFVNCLTI